MLQIFCVNNIVKRIILCANLMKVQKLQIDLDVWPQMRNQFILAHCILKIVFKWTQLIIVMHRCPILNANIVIKANYSILNRIIVQQYVWVLIKYVKYLKEMKVKIRMHAWRRNIKLNYQVLIKQSIVIRQW